MHADIVPAVAHGAIVFGLFALAVYDYPLAELAALIHGNIAPCVVLRATLFLAAGCIQDRMLDSDIIQLVRAAIENDLKAPKVPKERVPKLKKVWKCGGAHDFLYGQRAGYYSGLAEGMMLDRHGRQLTEGESEEVFEVLQPYLARLRKYFAYYGRTYTKK